jgi:DNA mismatch endonuclease Vsr
MASDPTQTAIRRALHAQGYRYRLHDRRLPGSPDLVFSTRRAAIEIRGCFWHRHGCANSMAPRTRAAWWERKLSGNVARDEANATALGLCGWRLHVAWECEIRRDLAGCLVRIRDFLGPPGLSDGSSRATPTAPGTFPNPVNLVR